MLEAFNYDGIFKLHQRRNPSSDRAQFDSGHWAWKIDERIDEVSLFEIIKTLNEFYHNIAISLQPIENSSDLLNTPK